MNNMYECIESFALGTLDRFIESKGGRDAFEKTKADASCSYEWEQIHELIEIYDWRHSSYKNKLQEIACLKDQDDKSDFDIYNLTDRSFDQITLGIRLSNLQRDFNKERFDMLERLVHVSRAF